VNFLGALEKERRATAAAIDSGGQAAVAEAAEDQRAPRYDPSGQPLQ
jgi:hypothetical protein